jgi:hypothetical protein
MLDLPREFRRSVTKKTRSQLTIAVSGRAKRKTTGTIGSGGFESLVTQQSD